MHNPPHVEDYYSSQLSSFTEVRPLLLLTLGYVGFLYVSFFRLLRWVSFHLLSLSQVRHSGIFRLLLGIPPFLFVPYSFSLPNSLPT